MVVKGYQGISGCSIVGVLMLLALLPLTERVFGDGLLSPSPPPSLSWSPLPHDSHVSAPLSLAPSPLDEGFRVSIGDYRFQEIE